MIQIETLEVNGTLPALHGMRNPKNSWGKQDSYYERDVDDIAPVHVGQNDHELAMKLSDGGPVHAKYRRMITVIADITAPLYWWKEFDTYRIGVEKNSCSTMHMIHAEEFTRKHFSTEHVISHGFSEADNFNKVVPMDIIDSTIKMLNECRMHYLFAREQGDTGRMKMFWWQMIQLLPSSYNQKRTVMMSYEALANMCYWRKNHKLDEWRSFVEWAKELPHSELFFVEERKNDEADSRI